MRIRFYTPNPFPLHPLFAQGFAIYLAASGEMSWKMVLLVFLITVPVVVRWRDD